MSEMLVRENDFDFNLIKIFNAVVESGNASRASERLSITPAAVSQALSRLQNIYSFKLFERTRKGLTPTKKGLELHKAYSHVVNVINATYSLSKINYDPPAITLLGSDIVENYYLHHFIRNDELIEKYEINHYAVNKNSEDTLAEMLLSGVGDILINLSPPKNFDIEVHLIDVFRQYVCICGNDNPLSILEQITLHHFYTFSHAVYQSDMFSPEVMVYTNSVDHRTERKIGYRSDSMLGVVNIVETTNMICIVPLELASFFKYTRGYDIKILSLPDEIFFKTIPVYASLYKKSKYYVVLREWIVILQSKYSSINDRDNLCQ